MKVAILFALVAAVSAGQIYNAPLAAGVAYGGVGIANTGSSHSSRAEDGLGNYQFAYNEQGATGGSARSESGDVYGRKTGSYALNVGDGRQRVVNYVADEFGYRAQIQTNEPGTAPLAGADTTISAPDTVGIAAATNHRAAKQLAALAAAPPQIAVAAPAYAAAPVAVAHAAPIAHAAYAHAPVASYGYAHAAPIANYGYAHAAPIAHVARAPVAYSTNVAHVAAAPIASSIYGASYAAPALSYGYGNVGLARAPLAVAKAW